VWNGTFVGTDYKDENRFDGGYPILPDSNSFANPTQNEMYAKRLQKYFQDNFEM
jgi:hypothetical protein